MSSEVSQLQTKLAASLKRRDALLAEVDALEAEVARLEAEDLQPLVDRLRAQIASIKKLALEMLESE